jgi:hypothetical protein
MASSNAGRWIEQTGVVWLLYELTGSAILLGLVGICRSLPSIVFAPIAGVIADRVDQRRMLFATQASGLVASLVLGILILLGDVPFWIIYVQVAAQAAIAAFDTAVRQALFPRLVPRSGLAEAVTLNATAGRTSALIGPAIGGLLIAGFGEAAPFFANAMTFTVLIGAVTVMTGVVPRSRTAGSSFRGELAEGLRYIVRTPVLAGILKLEAAAGLFSMNAVMITIVAREMLEAGPQALGALLSAPALGATIGISSLVLIGHAQRQGRFLVVCTFAYAAALLVFALSGSYLFSFAALALIGMLDSLISVTRHSILQLSAPGRMRGRVMGNVMAVTRGFGPLSQTQSGLLAASLGPPLAVITAAAAMAVATGLGALADRSLWRFTREAVGTRSKLEEPAGAEGPLS